MAWAARHRNLMRVAAGVGSECAPANIAACLQVLHSMMRPYCDQTLVCSSMLLDPPRPPAHDTTVNPAWDRCARHCSVHPIDPLFKQVQTCLVCLYINDISTGRNTSQAHPLVTGSVAIRRCSHHISKPTAPSVCQHPDYQ